MAAWTNAAGGAYHQRSFAMRPAVLRLAAAMFAGGIVLLLWGGSAEARGADTTPAASSDAGVLTGLLGQGGALTPVVDLVDGVTQPLTGSTPVGTTVDGVVSTVDPIVSPVLAPVTQAADPVVAPVLDTVGQVTEGITATITTPGVPTAPTTPTTPSTPGTPTTPVVPADPGTRPGGELPPLLPPGSTTEPGATPGRGSSDTDDPSLVDPGAPLPLALAAGPAGTAEIDPLTAALGGARAGRSSGSTADATSLGPISDGAGPDGPRASQGGVPDVPEAPLPMPMPCTHGTSGGTTPPAAAGPAWLGSDGAPTARGCAGLIDVPTVSVPPPAPPAGPDVSPD